MGKKRVKDPEEVALAAEFAVRIEALRKAMGWNQDEMADAVGRSRSAVETWESASNMFPAYVALRFCKLFDVTSDFLYYGKLSGLSVERIQWLREKGIIPK